MKREEVEHAVALAGLSVPEDVDYDVEGEDPILRSPHYLGNGAAVARLLTGVAANEMWRTRTGRSQRIHVDARHAAASLNAYRHLTFLDEAKKPRFTFGRGGPRLVNIVPTRDGRYLQLHSSTNDASQILEELGLDADASAEDAASAVAGRDAFELEAAFVRRRVCGGVVLSKEEWAQHPQGKAIARRPVVSITKIGESPAEALPEGDTPAAGVRVLDLTWMLAGPTCAKCIAEHGGDVLHVTSPNRRGFTLFDAETGIGKRQAGIDFTTDEGADELRELVRGADVFSQGYRLGALARRGFAPDQVAALRPGIVYVSENCYGQVGPWAERPGWEQLGQAATGMSHREGTASRAGIPRLAPAAVNDYTTGFFAAYGAMTALVRRATEGGSWHVQVSLAQTCEWYQRLGDDSDRESADAGDIAPFLAEMDTPDFGPIRYLSPALAMSETQPRWELPLVAHGSHAPVWLARS